MRALLLIVAIILICALVGWISFSSGPGKSSINVETEEIRQDTKNVLQSGAELLHQAGDKIEEKANQPNEQTPPVRNESAPVSR